MNCDNCEEPKNSRTAAAAGLALIRSCGITASISTLDIRSRIARSIRSRPTRYWFSINSPTERTRRLPRWSISSTVPRPSRNSTRALTTATMSSLRRVRWVSGTSSCKRMFIFTRPTVDRSKRSESKNMVSNIWLAASTVGGSPGRITR